MQRHWVTLFKHQSVFSTQSKLVRNLKSPKLWWPYLMAEHPGYMYQLKVETQNNFTKRQVLTSAFLCKVSVISVKNGIDEYTLPVGLREV